MANLTLPEGATNRQVALLAAAIHYSERPGAFTRQVIAAAEDFLKFLEDK